MSTCRPSNFGENQSTLGRSSRLEENVLQKQLSLMQSMRRQSDSKFGLESKAVTKRLKKNLERSTQTDSRITMMKQSMAPSNRRFYRIKDHSTAEILKDAWNNDNSRAKMSGMVCGVILPAALRLLEEHNMEISAQVRFQLYDLQKAHGHYTRRANTAKKRRLRSSANCRKDDLSRSSLYSRSSAMSPGLSDTPKEPQTSSYITSSDLELTLPQPRTIRSHTLQDIAAEPFPNDSPRPASAPGKYQHDRIYGSHPGDLSDMEFAEESPESNEYDDSFHNSIRDESNLFDSSIVLDRKVNDSHLNGEYDENMNVVPVALHELHSKVHKNLESVTLVDVHKALVVTKKYPQRMDSLTQLIKKWRPTEDEQDDSNADESPTPSSAS